MTTDEILNKVANHRQKQRELEEEWGQLREQALQECLRLIETFEFSASELNFGKDGRQAKPVIKNVGAPKFQNPDGPDLDWPRQASCLVHQSQGSRFYR